MHAFSHNSPSIVIPSRDLPFKEPAFPQSTSNRSLLILAISIVDSWSRQYSRCVRISCPRCRASQSNSFSSRERTCVMVAIYFRRYWYWLYHRDSAVWDCILQHSISDSPILSDVRGSIGLPVRRHIGSLHGFQPWIAKNLEG